MIAAIAMKSELGYRDRTDGRCTGSLMFIHVFLLGHPGFESGCFSTGGCGGSVVGTERVAFI